MAIAALGDDESIANIAHKHDVHPSQVTDWRRQLLERASTIFDAAAEPAQPAVDVKALHAKIGQFTLQNEFFKGLAQDRVGGPYGPQGGIAELKAMIDHSHHIPIKRQAELLAINRGSVYYHPEPVSEAVLRLMQRIDELHLEHPLAGARMLRDIVDRVGVRVGRRHMGTLMKRMGI